MQNPPIYTDEHNIGVEDAPDAILTPTFLAAWSTPPITSYTFSEPQTLPKNNEYDIIAQESEEAKKLILSSLREDEIQVVVGGDNSVTFTSICALLNRFKASQIAYIQIDSHGDMNTLHESISKNWHGLYLRPFLDLAFDIPQITSCVKERLLPEQVVFVGNLVLDDLEKKFFDEKKIKNLSVDDMRRAHSTSLEYLSRIISSTDHTHLTIDIDGFDKTIAPATGLPAEHGLLFDDVLDVLARIKHAQSFSVDLVEVNPQKQGAEKTIALAQKLLNTLLAP